MSFSMCGPVDVGAKFAAEVRTYSTPSPIIGSADGKGEGCGGHSEYDMAEASPRQRTHACRFPRPLGVNGTGMGWG
jgi:hypothetical protein